MTQATDWGLGETSPQTPVAYSQQGNESFDALLTGHLGTARPAYAEQGTDWLKDTGVSPKVFEVYFYDGADDILTATVDVAANTYTPVVSGVALLESAQTFTKTQTWTKGADVASATNLTLGDGNYFDITGTTTVTGIATKGTGTVIKLHFDGVLTLTHNASTFILPGGANITTAAGDDFEFTEYTTGSWRCTGYALASGSAIVANNVAINAQTGTTYTTVLTDANKLVTLSNGSAIALTIPTNASVAYSVGTTIAFQQIGAGLVTMSGAGVTFQHRNGLVSGGQYAVWSITKTATDTWAVAGDLTT